MIINLDCDGVLFDLDNYFLDWLFSKYDGVRRTTDQIDHRGWTASLGLPPHVREKFFQEVKLYKHCARLPLYLGAEDFIMKLQKHHDVYACTASSSSAWTGQRSEALERLGIDHKHQFICPKGEKWKIEADVLIDDRANECTAFINAGPDVDHYGHRRAILFRAPQSNGVFAQCGYRGLAKASTYSDVHSLLNGTLEWR